MCLCFAQKLQLLKKDQEYAWYIVANQLNQKRKKCSQKYNIPELQSFEISFASFSLSSSSVVGVLETYTNHKYQRT